LLRATTNMTDAEIALFDLNGVLQRSVVVDLTEGVDRRIRVEGLACGMYIVETRWSGEVIRKPFHILR
jgi:hypothetical protein